MPLVIVSGDTRQETIKSPTVGTLVSNEFFDVSSCWLDGYPPTVYTFTAWGVTDEAPMSITVEAYPADSLSGKIDIDFISDIIKATANRLLSFLNKFKKVAELELEIIPPQGEISIKAGWKEYTDWRAYYSWELLFGLSTLIGLKCKFAVDLLALAAMAVDVPPGLTDKFAKLDAGVEIGGSIGVNGRVARTGPPDSVELATGLVPSGKLSLAFVIKPKTENGVIADVSLEGSASTGFTVAVDIQPVNGSNGGLVFTPTISMDAIILKLTFTYYAFKTDLYSWKISDGWVIYGPDHHFILFGNS